VLISFSLLHAGRVQVPSLTLGDPLGTLVDSSVPVYGSAAFPFPLTLVRLRTELSLFSQNAPLVPR